MAELYLSSAHSEEGGAIVLWIRDLLIEGVHSLCSSTRNKLVGACYETNWV